MGDQPEHVWGEGERLIWFLAVWYVVMTAIRLARYTVEYVERIKHLWLPLRISSVLCLGNAYAISKMVGVFLYEGI